MALRRESDRNRHGVVEKVEKERHGVVEGHWVVENNQCMHNRNQN